MVCDSPELTPIGPLHDPVAVELEKIAHEHNGRGWFLSAILGSILLVAFGGILYLATRKPTVLYVRLDAIGNAVPVAYSAFQYTAQPLDARANLFRWAEYSYERQKESIGSTYRRRFFFMTRELVTKVRAEDARSREIDFIKQGRLASNTLTIDLIQLTNFRSLQDQDIAATGSAEIHFTKHFYANLSTPGLVQHWVATVNFVISPRHPPELPSNLMAEYQMVNPLGFLITYMDEQPQTPMEKESK